MRYTLAASLLIAATLTTAAPAFAPDAKPVPRISSEAFAKPPFIANPQLSPDGTRLVAEMLIDGKKVLGIAPLTSNDLTVIPLREGDDLIGYSWAGNGRIIMRHLQRYVINEETYPIRRAFVYDLASGNSTVLGPQDQGQFGDNILWVDPDGKSLLLGVGIGWPYVVRVDLATGNMETVQGGQEGIVDWYADQSGVVRFGIGYGQYSIRTKYRRGATDRYVSPPRTDYDDDAALDALTLIPGSDDGYALSSSKTGRYALYHYNFATRTIGALVYESPTNDLTSASFDSKTGEIDGIDLTDDRERTIWFDPAMKDIHARLQKTFKNRETAIVSRSRDNGKVIVLVNSSADPGTYYLYTATTGALTRLGKVAEQVDPAGLSVTSPISYPARDGLTINGYLTLPAGRPASGLPLIIMPHGGPYDVRDSLGYDPEVQFLANRGYAVLQPNFRGSGGYGKAFYEKGVGQWGRAMQDDLDDGMDWLVKVGTVDAKRVCIVGGSYGGYAALWGATRNPERYRCAVSFAGISDLKSQLDYQSDFFTGTRYRKDWQRTVKGASSFDLSSVSPLAKVVSLRVPVMLVHGDKDSRVPPKQSTKYDRALTAAGKPHETYIIPGAGHGFDKPSDEKTYLDRLEAFLTKHNPA